MELIADRNHRWWTNDRELTKVRGAQVIDINATPSTNTIAVKRLGLGSGDSGEVKAAWVRFPRLEVQPLLQTYRNLGGRKYSYSSDSFKTRMTLAADGLVTHYPPFWRRVK